MAPDLFSVRGLENVGARLKTWRSEGKDRVQSKPRLDFELSSGEMKPIGYVVSRLTNFARGPVRSFQKWIDRMPVAYRGSVDPSTGASNESLCLGRLEHYRSLVAMAQEASKPMFKMKLGDGAIGGHQSAVTSAYDDFEALAQEIKTRVTQEILRRNDPSIDARAD